MANITITPTGTSFGGTDTVTAARLNEARNPTAALDTGTIVNADVSATANITGSKLANTSVPFEKLDDVINDATMATATNTTLATSESIKAYVDEYAIKYSGETGTISATATYVDWDLSAFVGTNRAMVVLELWNASSGASIMLRPNGSAFEPRDTDSIAGYGASGLVCDTGNVGGTAVVVTDESGIIEIKKAGTGTQTVNYKIQSYQKIA